MTELTLQLPALLHMEDRASMHYSVETRVPFCTGRVSHLAHQLELAWIFRDGYPKGIVRDAFSDVIPESIRLRREKVGRPIPLRRWLDSAAGTPMREELRKKQQMFLELTGVDLVSKAFETGNPFDRLLWSLLSVSRWIDLYQVTV